MPGNYSEKSQESDWTFNFRTSSRFFDDSDSDSALNEEDTLANTASAKNRLLDGIDLSTREETVVYKPNPFSIAKINAANRAQNQTHRAPTQGRQNISGSPQALRRPSKLVSKPTQTNVLDGFKIQAQKAGLRIKPAASSAKQSRAMEASNAPVLAQEPYPVPNVASVSPLESECVSSTTPIHRRMEGQYETSFLFLTEFCIAFLSSILSSNSAPLDNAHILAQNSLIANYQTTFKENIQKNVLPTVPLSRNSIPLDSVQFVSRFTQNFNSRPSRTALPMSSPLRGNVSASATNLNDARFSSPIAAGPRSDIPSSIPYRRKLFKPSEPSARTESRISCSFFILPLLR